MNYPFPAKLWRAQPLYVVDGDTADLFVDVGFKHYGVFRFRFLDIDTAELRDRDPVEREKAKAAKTAVQQFLNCFHKTTKVDLAHWPIKIETERATGDDAFGRYLCRIFFELEGKEVSLNAQLLSMGLAEPYDER